MPLRADFEKHFKLTGSIIPLRGLAQKIAQYECHRARTDCFFSAAPPPYNFLANGEANAYTPLSPIECPLKIAEWKFNRPSLNCCLERGFSDIPDYSPTLGLSMLFDPLVDAVLAANTGISLGGFAPKSGATVIVLTDYGAIWDKTIKVIGYTRPDWGEDETVNILHPPPPASRKQLSPTIYNLWECLCPPGWRTNTDLIGQTLRKKNILIWNLIPFFRGGSGSSSDAELPHPKCGHWLEICMNWLCEFYAGVNACKIVLCVNKARLIGINGQGISPVSSNTWQKCFPSSTPNCISDLVAKGKVFVLNHPSSRHFFSSKDCEALKDICSQGCSTTKGNLLEETGLDE